MKENLAMNNTHQNDFEYMKFLTKEIEELARENGKTQKDLHEKTEKCEVLERKIKNISNVNIEFVSNDKET